MKNINKPVVILTTFWDANVIARNGGFLLHDGRTVKVNGDNAFSIALGCPDNEKIKYILPMQILKFFCPTYDMLIQYKEDKKWDVYSNLYFGLLDKRRDKISSWLDNLSLPVYFLCCWENTSKKIKCHRQLLLEFLHNEYNDKIELAYRHGHENKTCCESIVGKRHEAERIANARRATNRHELRESIVSFDFEYEASWPEDREENESNAWPQWSRRTGVQPSMSWRIENNNMSSDTHTMSSIEFYVYDENNGNDQDENTTS